MVSSFVDGGFSFSRYHPDKNTSSPDAAEKFKEVAYSYGILSDPEKRRQYDASGFEVFIGPFRETSLNVANFCGINLQLAGPSNRYM